MVARILLIDGDDGTRQQYAEFLRSAGFHVVAMPDAHGAIDLARESRTDIVVTDAKPRGAIDGIEVARRLRNSHGAMRIPVVVLTAIDDDDGRAKARAVGCDAVLDRPCEPAVLASEVRRLIAEHPHQGRRETPASRTPGERLRAWSDG